MEVLETVAELRLDIVQFLTEMVGRSFRDPANGDDGGSFGGVSLTDANDLALAASLLACYLIDEAEHCGVDGPALFASASARLQAEATP